MAIVTDPTQYITSGSRAFIHGGAATPFALIRLLIARASSLQNVELIHLHTLGEAEYALPRFMEHFKITNLFVGPNMRDKMKNKNVDYLPCHLSEIPNLFRSGKRAVDFALIHLSRPDKHGYCSLGVSVDVAKAAIDSAKIIIAQINQQMPRTNGDGFIHIGKIHYAIEVDEPLPVSNWKPPSEAEQAIGRLTAGLIEDGSTLQVGIGAVPDAILSSLIRHQKLGLHSEMWSDGVLKLIQSGVIDNSQKKLQPGKSVSSFLIGSKELYDFVHDNPSVLQLEAEYVNNPAIIAINPKVIAINSAVEIDLTGQVCADSIGSRIISGVGGQMDFVRGACLSKGGKAIIALTSRTREGKSRLVSVLRSGAGVVTTRAHVHYVVTEFGIANLYGKTLNERARALIQIAHPLDQEDLERGWSEKNR